MGNLSLRLARLEAGNGLAGTGCPRCWTPPFLDAGDDVAPLDSTDGVCPSCGRRPRVRAVVIQWPDERPSVPYLFTA